MKNVVYVFIDVSNLWQAQKVKGKFFNLEKLKGYLASKYIADEIQIYYYVAYPKEGTREYSTDAKHKFFTFFKKGLSFV